MWKGFYWLVILFTSISLTAWPKASLAISATINIAKDFSDDNAAEVLVSLACSGSGPQGGMISEGNPLQFPPIVLSEGATCLIQEDPVPVGYTESYSADCDINPVVDGETYNCIITNTNKIVFKDGFEDPLIR